MRLDNVAVSEISDPPHCIYMTPDAMIDRMSNLLLHSNWAPVPVVAVLDDKKIVVGNVETILAARKIGMPKMECQVADVESEGQVLELHYIHSKSRIHNPAALYSLVRDMKSSGVDMGILSREYEAISEYNIYDSTLADIDKFCKKFKNTENMPTMTHIIRPLAKISDESDQNSAVQAIFRYVASNKSAPTLPDSHMIRNIVSQYSPDDDDTVTVQPLEGAGKGGGYNEGGALVDDNPEPATEAGAVPPGSGGMMQAVPGVLNYTCECSIPYSINLKSGTIRKMVDTGSAVGAVEVGGDVVYALGRRESEILELDMQPVINAYEASGAVILSRKKISKAGVAKISAVIGK